MAAGVKTVEVDASIGMRAKNSLGDALWNNHFHASPAHSLARRAVRGGVPQVGDGADTGGQLAGEEAAPPIRDAPSPSSRSQSPTNGASDPWGWAPHGNAP